MYVVLFHIGKLIRSFSAADLGRTFYPDAFHVSFSVNRMLILYLIVYLLRIKIWYKDSRNKKEVFSRWYNATVYNLIIEIKKINETIMKSAWIAKYFGIKISKISETEVKDSYENTIIIDTIYDDK